jgi:hypothetical protein
MKTIRQQYVETFPPPEQAEAARITRVLATDDDDPLLWILLQMRRTQEISSTFWETAIARFLGESRTARKDWVERFDALPNVLNTRIRVDLESHLAAAHELKKQIGGKGIWLKLLASKLATAFATAVIVWAAVTFLRTKDQQVLKTLSTNSENLIENQKTLFGFQTDYYKAMQAADDHAAALYAISRLLDLPNVAMSIDPKAGLTLLVPRNSVRMRNLNETQVLLQFNTVSTPEESKKTVENEDIDPLLDRVYKRDQK